MKRDRSYRRHHNERMLNRMLATGWWKSHWDLKRGTNRRLLCRKWRDNMKKCSCYMCGNPRRHFGDLPIQEKRLLIAARLDEETAIEEYDSTH